MLDKLARALLANLNDHGLRAGDGEPPEGQTFDVGFEPYVVLWCPIRGGTVDGSLVDDDDWDVRFQLTAYGETASQARIISRRAHAAVIEPVSIAGVDVQHVRLLSPGDGLFSDLDVDPPVYEAPRVYGARIQPT